MKTKSKKRILQQQKYVDKNREKINRKSRERQHNISSSWREYFSKYQECECCGCKIGFMNKSNRLCFDHRNEGNEVIKGCPSAWLRKHYCTPENIKIFESCKFGILCNRCNYFIPTKNRKVFVDLLLKYVNQNWN